MVQTTASQLSDHPSDAPRKSAKKQVLIVGGGYAGVCTAIKLAKKSAQHNFDVTLVTKEPMMDMKIEIDLVVPNTAEHDFCRIWLPALANRYGFKLVLAKMNGIDTEAKTISVLPSLNAIQKVAEKREVAGNLAAQKLTAHQIAPEGKTIDELYIPCYEVEPYTLSYDTLVMAVGANCSCPPIEGLGQYASTMWWVHDISTFKKEVEGRLRLAVGEMNAEIRRKLLTFTIIGGGATGVEICGPLAQFTYARASRMGIPESEISIRLIDGNNHVLKQLDDSLRIKADERLKKLGVELVLNTHAKRLTETTIELDNGMTLDRGLCLFVGGARVESWVHDLGLEMEQGRLAVNEDLTLKNHPDIYAAGDVAGYIDVKHGASRPTPMLAQHAIHQAQLVAKNILADFAKGAHKEYDATLQGEFVSIGYGYSVGHARGIKIAGHLGELAKKGSYAFCWYNIGGIRLVLQRWLESAAMKRYTIRAHRGFAKID